jgi:hypothetical protein
VFLAHAQSPIRAEPLASPARSFLSIEDNELVATPSEFPLAAVRELFNCFSDTNGIDDFDGFTVPHFKGCCLALSLFTEKMTSNGSAAFALRCTRCEVAFCALARRCI